MPQILLAAVNISLLRGWPTVAALLLLGWCAMLRPGDMAALHRRHFLFPSNRGDVLQQVARVPSRRPHSDQAVRALFEAENRDQALWPGSPSTLRHRPRKISLASLPGGGATAHYAATEDPGWVCTK